MQVLDFDFHGSDIIIPTGVDSNTWFSDWSTAGRAVQSDSLASAAKLHWRHNA